MKIIFENHNKLPAQIKYKQINTNTRRRQDDNNFRENGVTRGDPKMNTLLIIKPQKVWKIVEY